MKRKALLEKARKVSKANFLKMKSGIVDGRFLLPVGSQYIVQRTRNEMKIISFCVLKDILQNGDVTMWDESVTQFFSFNIKDLDDIVVKIPD